MHTNNKRMECNAGDILIAVDGDAKRICVVRSYDGAG